MVGGCECEWGEGITGMRLEGVNGEWLEGVNSGRV